MKAIQKINQIGIPDNAKDAVAFWDLMSAQFARGSVASQIMCGFALIELRKERGTNQGKRTDLCGTTSPKAFGEVELDWPEFIEKTYGFSDDTARNRITMAEGVKAKFKKLGLAERFKALLQTHPSEWSQTDTKLISEALQKATDGMSQMDFLRQLGIAKKQSGNTTTTDRKPPGKLTADQQAEELKRQALEDSGHMGNAVVACNKSFVLLSDFEIKAQIALMERGIKLRLAWTSQPASKRDVTVIEKMLKEKP